MRQDWRLLVICGLVLIAALVLGVGIVSHGVLRHIVQTVPMWIAIVLAIRGSGYAKWAALPCFWFWLVLMIEIWLFLLGVNHLISGTFTPIERAMTIVVAIASAVAIMKSIRHAQRSATGAGSSDVCCGDGAAVLPHAAELYRVDRAQVVSRGRGARGGEVLCRMRRRRGEAPGPTTSRITAY